MNFDIIARHYNWIEKIIFRSDLEKFRCMNIELIKDAKKGDKVAIEWLRTTGFKI